MFCERCGTELTADQSFCPTCGSPVSVPGFSDSLPAPAGKKLNLKGSAFEKFNDMEKMEQLYFLITAGLLIVCFVLAMLKLYSISGSGKAVALASASSFLLVAATMYFTIAIGLVILEYLEKLEGLWIWFFLVCGAALILLLYILTWINGMDDGIVQQSLRLSVGGWFFLVLQTGLVASSVLLLLEKLKKTRPF